MNESRAKYIERNRPPRVQIVYEVHRDGSPTTVELPFVMGVMADLAGASETIEAKKEVPDRKFEEIDAKGFSTFMEALAPRVKASVPSRLPLDPTRPTNRKAELAAIDEALGTVPGLDAYLYARARMIAYNLAKETNRDFAEVAGEIGRALKDPEDAGLPIVESCGVDVPKNIRAKIKILSGGPQSEHAQAQAHLLDLLDAKYADRLGVDLTFRSMGDFAPDKIAEQVPALAELLKMRRQLGELLGFMGGRLDAEKSIAQLLSNEPLLRQVAKFATAEDKGAEG